MLFSREACQHAFRQITLETSLLINGMEKIVFECAAFH